MLKKLSPFALLLLFANCSADTQYTDQNVPATAHVEHFGKARLALDTDSTVHVGAVMETLAMQRLTREELDWAAFSSGYLGQMTTSLQILGECHDSAGEFLDVSNSIAALTDLELELRAHEIGMLSSYDLATAHAVEMNFHGRQQTLLEELEAHFQQYESMSADYSCPF